MYRDSFVDVISRITIIAGYLQQPCRCEASCGLRTEDRLESQNMIPHDRHITVEWYHPTAEPITDKVWLSEIHNIHEGWQLILERKRVRQRSSHASYVTVSYCQQQSLFFWALGNTTHNCKSMKKRNPNQSDTVWHSARTLSRWVLASTVIKSVPNRCRNRYDVPWTPRRRCTFSSSCWELHPEPMRSMPNMSQYVSALSKTQTKKLKTSEDTQQVQWLSSIPAIHPCKLNAFVILLR